MTITLVKDPTFIFDSTSMTSSIKLLSQRLPVTFSVNKSPSFTTTFYLKYAEWEKREFNVSTSIVNCLIKLRLGADQSPKLDQNERPKSDNSIQYRHSDKIAFLIS